MPKWRGNEIPHSPTIYFGGCGCAFCQHRFDVNRSAEVHSALQKATKARHEARSAERELLLATGWEEQMTTEEGTTWWYREDAGGSDPQDSAVRFQLMEYERANRA